MAATTVPRGGVKISCDHGMTDLDGGDQSSTGRSEDRLRRWYAAITAPRGVNIGCADGTMDLDGGITVARGGVKIRWYDGPGWRRSPFRQEGGDAATQLRKRRLRIVLHVSRAGKVLLSNHKRKSPQLCVLLMRLPRAASTHTSTTQCWKQSGSSKARCR